MWRAPEGYGNMESTYMGFSCVTSLFFLRCSQSFPFHFSSISLHVPSVQTSLFEEDIRNDSHLEGDSLVRQRNVALSADMALLRKVELSNSKFWFLIQGNLFSCLHPIPTFQACLTCTVTVRNWIWSRNLLFIWYGSCYNKSLNINSKWREFI